MTDYLIEIGTEELPYKFVPSAMEQLKDSFKNHLKENRIEFKDIKTYGTPRRLAVIINDISESQPDIIKKIKGPPANVASDKDGNLTPAGIGFTKKQGINPEQLYKETVGNIEYVFADINEKGQPTGNILKDIVPDIILKLQGSHFMRWGYLDIKFSRPIRWIVSLLNSEELKIKIGNIESTRYSRPHRFFPEEQILITSPENYIDKLFKAQVIVDQDKRREEIIKKSEKVAESIGARVYLSPELLEEVNYLVEYPVPVLGSFDKKYLVVPKDVIITVMASHQRYFPVFEQHNDKLTNYFITISNNDGNLENIVQGNQRVIKARLDDAIFFYTEDRKRSLESRIEDLKGITFQKGLGTVYDKTGRIREIAYFICEDLGLGKETVNKIEKTSLLCKADLGTNLVREFTELQGIIGAEYAKLDGEDCLVSAGIREHYLPVSADSELADTITGQITGIADKIDTICGVFALGKIPTGSADPLGLRRAALGIVLTLLRKNININLSKVIENAILAQPVKIEDKKALKDSINDFIVQRLRIYLTETYKYDIVEAVLNSRDPLMDLKDVLERIKILSRLVKKENYMSFHEAANRVSRIIKSGSFKPLPEPSLFVENIESQLWDCISSIEENKVDYNELIKRIEACIPLIDEFFEKVLVMDPDPEIRENRFSLLGNIRAKFLKLADFSKIVA